MTQVTIINRAERAKLRTFMNAVSKDIQQSLILFLSERGHGKSTSLKTIFQHLKRTHPEITFKVIDVSLSWYKTAPLAHRQRVTLEKIQRGQVANLADCVYEVGDLSVEHRREFVATLIDLDMQRARQRTLAGEPVEWVIFILEESNCYFGSYALRKQDQASTILQDFVSVGRNFKMSAFLVATAEIGELSPSLRRRVRRIYGRVTSPSDLAHAKRTSKALAETVKTQPKYTFTYVGDYTVTAKIPDTCHSVPVDHTAKTPTHTQSQTQFNGNWWFTFLGTLGIFLAFWGALMGL